MDLIIYPIIWCAFGAWCYYVSKGRNDNNPWLWFVIGVLLGIIGVIFCYIFSGRKQNQNN